MPIVNKALFIGGPTATGKTTLAFKLAEKFSGDIISADSRQVYLGLDIVTGKDIPDGFVWESDHYFNGKTTIYGYDLIKPGEDWNVALFRQYALETIKYLWSKNRLPIIVGGTGLYLKSLFEPFISSHNPPDHLFRNKLANLSVADLQERLIKTIPDRYNQMNHSDQNNPRRLIRALEIDFYTRFPSAKITSLSPQELDSLAIALTAPISILEPKIKARVLFRLKQNLKPELDYLKSFNLNWSSQSATSLGYHELDQYFAGKLTKAQLITLWTTHERQYAKRQLTWFKKQTQYKWFTVTDKKYPASIVELVQSWYSQTNG